MRAHRVTLAAIVFVAVGAVGAVQGAPTAAQPGSAWPMGGHDHANTRWNPVERTLSPATVPNLTAKWTHATRGDVSATPAVVGGAVYFPDWGGGFSKVDAATGEPLWQRSVPEYVGIAEAVSRSSPAVVGDTVYIGTQRGARLLAIDTATGDLRWSTTMDDHPSAILTQSPMVSGGIVFQGVSSDEEIAAIDPAYDCCTFRGSVAAVDAATGEILWRTYLNPGTEAGSAGRYSGTAVWSGTPAIDPRTRTLYITTGNNYTVPDSVEECQESGGTPSECAPDNHLNSIVALDTRTGAIKWASGEDTFDTWNGGCIIGPPPNNCPPIAGPDHDFADGAHLLTVRGPDGRPRKLVGAGQKSGIYWMVDATTGEIVWSAAAGPGSPVGGIQWGTATDGDRVYLVETNFFRAEYGLPDGQVIDYSSFAALDAATGEVVWQIPEPHGGLAQGAVSVANGVLYAGSLAGHMYAIDAATGEVRWESRGEGSSNAGPAIVNGTVYWGNGYQRAGIGTASRTFYAFDLPRS
ncbi:PQQ-binding-like beta-propeller repeat protein [Actinophytocola sp.]|uniref:outer membrane protein assembly factor BamB family protein n=1 Tax=Actinophytocola sp. TaxID=1872138 RepID=UPI002ED4D986